MRAWGWTIVWICCNTVQAGDCLTAATTIRLESGFTVVPFAVPVAVPVATVQNPAVLYGYAPAPSAARAPMAAPVERTSTPSQTIFERHCAECHRGTAAQGKLPLFDEHGQLFEQLPRQAILEMVSPDAQGTQAMPPGSRSKLNEEELQILRDWAKPPKNLVY